MDKIILIFVTLAAIPLQAQSFKQLDWTKGAVQLLDYTWLEGEIHYENASDQVCFQNQQKMKVYEPHEIRAFGFVDQNTGIYRHFGTYYQSPRSANFYERIVTGKCEFLLRQIESAAVSNTLEKQQIQGIQNSYYLWYKNQLVRLRGGGKELKELFDLYGENLQEMAKEYHLGTSKPSDQAHLVFLLNSKLNAGQEPEGLQVDLGY